MGMSHILTDLMQAGRRGGTQAQGKTAPDCQGMQSFFGKQ